MHRHGIWNNGRVNGFFVLEGRPWPSVRGAKTMATPRRFQIVGIKRMDVRVAVQRSRRENILPVQFQTTQCHTFYCISRKQCMAKKPGAACVDAGRYFTPKQSMPRLSKGMNPIPDHGENSYKGSGKLTGKRSAVELCFWSNDCSHWR